MIKKNWKDKKNYNPVFWNVFAYTENYRLYLQFCSLCPEQNNPDLFCFYKY